MRSSLRDSRAPRHTLLWIGILAVVLLAVIVLSLAVGAKPISLSTVMSAIVDTEPGNPDHLIVVTSRIPRTMLGVLCGVALGLGGVLIQGLTRNPLADPGILGINAGASLCVVLAITFLGVTTPFGYVWFAFGGAAVTMAFVFLVARRAQDGTPIALVLAGAAVTAAMTSLVSAILITHSAVLNTIRFWQVGSLAGRDVTLFWSVLPFVVVGLIIAAALAGPLNALALGDELATGLGQRVGVIRGFGATAIVLLCGASTAAIGPVSFVGLLVPHIARRVTGPDHRSLMPVAALVGSILVLGADVLGRVVARPGEVEVGIMTALIGAPALIVLIKRGGAGR